MEEKGPLEYEAQPAKFLTREIQSHHDGHGLNEALEIVADGRDEKAGNASHFYQVRYAGRIVAAIQFQHGPRDEPGSAPGATEAALLAILIDRMDGFQAGPYACRENALVRTKLEEALHWTRHRADERAKRGVLGKNEK